MTGAIFLQLFLDSGPLAFVYFGVLALILVFLKISRKPPDIEL